MFVQTLHKSFGLFIEVMFTHIILCSFRHFIKASDSTVDSRNEVLEKSGEYVRQGETKNEIIQLK